MTSEEVQHYDYMAATRLSEVGYRRYLRAKSAAFTHQQVKVVRKALKEFIDRWDARDMKIAMMVHCAPMRSALE